MRALVLSLPLVVACGARTPVSETVGGDAAATPAPDASGSDASRDAAGPGVCSDPAPGPAPTCKYGTEALQCFTQQQLAAMWNDPPRGGDGVIDAGPPPFDSCGCLPAAAVSDQAGCCNPATDGPYFTSEGCCYHFCLSGCC